MKIFRTKSGKQDYRLLICFNVRGTYIKTLDDVSYKIGLSGTW